MFSRCSGAFALSPSLRASRQALRALRHCLPVFLAGVLFASLTNGLLSSCGDDTQRRFSSFPAFLRLTPVSAAPALRSAVSSPGSWCLVTYDAHRYQLTPLSGGAATSLPRTALEAYGRPQSIAGFIVGTPSVPAFDGTFPVMAYDAVCPVCYNSDNIERRLIAAPDRFEHVSCERCSRLYDLSNGGIPVNAPADGRRSAHLFRYRAAYTPTADVFVVQN